MMYFFRESTDRLMLNLVIVNNYVYNFKKFKQIQLYFNDPHEETDFLTL